MNKTSSKVITSVQRRRRWSPDEKMSLIQETYSSGNSVSSVARQHGISPSQLFYWRRCMENGAVVAVGAEEQVVSETEYKKALAKIRELERALGKSTLKVEILTEAVKIGREKKLISRAPLQGLDDFQ
jgi:transposase